MVRRHPNGHHILFDELPEMNAGVEARCDRIDAAVIRGDVEDDVRVVARELSQLRCSVLYGPSDVRFEERDAPAIIKPTDAVIRMSAT